MTAQDSRKEKLLAAALLALQAANDLAPAGVAYNRWRRAPVQSAELPMTSVYVESEDAAPVLQQQRLLCPTVRRTLTVAVRHRAMGADDSAAEPQRMWTLYALMQDASLGGLALGISEKSTSWDAEDDANGTTVQCTQLFEIEYTTGRGDLRTAK